MAIFTNQATLSYNDVVTNSNITTGQILETLTATKTAVVDTYTQGDSITYVISLVNSGPTPFTGITLTDDLGGYTFGTETLYPLTYVDGSALYYINGVLQPTPAVTAGPPLTVTGINVPAGGNATLVYETTVNQFAPLAEGATITNTATFQGGNLNTPITAEETVTAQARPNLTITKSLSPTTVTDNSRLTYTFVIQNYGNTEIVATDNAVITDTFNPILTDLVVTYNGATWTTPANYVYNEATGLFTTVAGQITVPAATFTQDPETGVWLVNPGVTVVTVTGTV